MNAMKFLLTISTVAAMVVLAPCASAYMVITYKTGEMYFQNEKSTEQGATHDFDSYFYDMAQPQFEISFITPDFNLATGIPQQLIFHDPVVTISEITDSVDFPRPFTIDKGSFISFDLSADDSLQLFSFSVSFTAAIDPLDGISRHGTVTSNGNINPVYLDSWNVDAFTFEKNDWTYKRHEEVWIFDTTANFSNESFNPMTIDKVSVPEPYTLVMLFMGLACVTAQRKINFLKR